MHASALGRVLAVDVDAALAAGGAGHRLDVAVLVHAPTLKRTPDQPIIAIFRFAANAARVVAFQLRPHLQP